MRKGQRATLETRGKHKIASRGERNGMFGKKHSEESRLLMSKNRKGLTAGPNHPLYGKTLPFKTRRLMSINHTDNSGKNHQNYGKHLSEETRRQISLGGRGKTRNSGPRLSIRGTKNPNWRGGGHVSCTNCGRKIWRAPYRKGEHNFCNYKCQGEWQSRTYQRNEATVAKISTILKEMWQDPEFAQKMIRSWHIKPTILEQVLDKILIELSLPYRYVGDGDFILGGKCPDFLNTNGQKKLIELYGDYWHQGEDPQQRIDYFGKFGFQTLIIWEHELKAQMKLKEKLLQFEGR